MVCGSHLVNTTQTHDNHQLTAPLILTAPPLEHHHQQARSRLQTLGNVTPPTCNVGTEDLQCDNLALSLNDAKHDVFVWRSTDINWSLNYFQLRGDFWVWVLVFNIIQVATLSSAAEIPVWSWCCTTTWLLNPANITPVSPDHLQTNAQSSALLTVFLECKPTRSLILINFISLSQLHIKTKLTTQSPFKLRKISAIVLVPSRWLQHFVVDSKTEDLLNDL